MSFKNFLAATSLAMLPLAAGAATFIVPVAGTGPGANGSLWSSDVTLHNTSTAPVTVTLAFHDRYGVTPTTPVTVAGRATVTVADIVRTRFTNDRGPSFNGTATGGIEITVPDAAANKITITSRTVNDAPTGQFGEDIDVVRSTDAATLGDLTTLAAPSDAAKYRMNFGAYAIEPTVVRWELMRADGTLVATREVTYAAGEQAQYNNGILTLFNAQPQNDDAIHAFVIDGRAVFYGSAINNATGDPSFVRGIRAKEDARINFVGIDLDEDGTVDVFDANHDGVADAPIDVFTSTFPSYFRIVSNNETGAPIAYQIVSDTPNVELISPNGTVIWAPTGDLKGQTGALKVRARSGLETAILTIPVRFR
jgi:hypothetical protein